MPGTETTRVEEIVRRDAEELERVWRENPRWARIERPYRAEDVIRLRGSFASEHTLARRGAERLWDLLQAEDYVPALGCLTGGQAVEAVKASLEAIYVSGWQVAVDANLALETYPDQSLYPSDSVPAAVRRNTMTTIWQGREPRVRPETFDTLSRNP